MDHDAAALDLASRQHGAASVRQARALGLTADGIHHRIQQGRLRRASSRVLLVSGSTPSIEQRMMVAVLHHGPDAYLARATALALWGLPGFERIPVELVCVRRRNNEDASIAIVHTSRDLAETHLAELHGLPVTTPARALFDIAATLHPKRVERAVDNALARRLVTVPLLHRTLAELADRGRSGITLMRALLEARRRDYRPPGSNTEARLNELLKRAGQRRLAPQREVGSEEAWIGRVDYGDDELPTLVVEVQSDLFHGSLLDRRRDEQRLAALRGAGFVVLELWESEIWHRPDEAVAKVIAARAQARHTVLVPDHRPIGRADSEHHCNAWASRGRFDSIRRWSWGTRTVVGIRG
jgi:very-short-patch-repair endonuclease